MVLESPDIFEEVLTHIQTIVVVLEQELKRIKIFKFKMYLENDGEYLTNNIDQELKHFLSTYPFMQRNTKKRMTKQKHTATPPKVTNLLPEATTTPEAMIIPLEAMRPLPEVWTILPRMTTQGYMTPA